MPDPDDIFEGWVEWLAPLWGPFYAVFYILRLLIRELFANRKKG